MYISVHYTYTHKHVYKGIYFKELVSMTVGAGTSEILRAGWQAGNSGRIGDFSLDSEFLLPQEISVFAWLLSMG